MTERAKLKSKLRKLNHYLKDLPRLIDLSKTHGDDFYTDADILDAKQQIAEVEAQIAAIDAQTVKP